MKTIGLIALPLLCAAGIVMADSIGSEGAADQTAARATPSMSPAHYRMARHGMKRLPSGDIRQCLDLKSNAEIIRCSETRRKR